MRRANCKMQRCDSNFRVKMHNTLRTTPAMAAGVVNELWTVAELVEKTDA
jgi:hypothetical protein